MCIRDRDKGDGAARIRRRRDTYGSLREREGRGAGTRARRGAGRGGGGEEVRAAGARGARPHLSQCPADRRDTGDRGVEHRPQHHLALDIRRDRAGGQGDGGAPRALSPGTARFDGTPRFDEFRRKAALVRIAGARRCGDRKSPRSLAERGLLRLRSDPSAAISRSRSRAGCTSS